ncbi:MAG: DivIVA domain-containing protein [Nocardioidaceae bacterium]
MIWFLGLLVVILIGAVAVVAAGHGGSLAPVQVDRPDVFVPADRDLTAQDLRTTRFTVAFRGYRMDEVDSLVRRLTMQLEAAEAPPREPGEPDAG